MKFLGIFISILFMFDPHVVVSQDKLHDSNNLKMQRSVHLSTGAIFGTLAAVPCLVLLVLAIVKFWCTSPLDRLLSGINARNIDGSQGRLVRSSFRRLSGLNKRSIELIPLFRFSSIKGARVGLECAVCISRFEDTEFLRLLPKCRHAFHSNCIDQWLEGQSSCPLCRSEFELADLSRSISESSDHVIFIQNSADDRRLLLDQPKHKAMSNVMIKNQWSGMRSSDMLFLSSEMLQFLSENRISTSESSNGVEPGDDGRTLKGQMLIRSHSVSETPSTPVTLGGRRSMSEILSVPRFKTGTKIQVKSQFRLMECEQND